MLVLPSGGWRLGDSPRLTASDNGSRVASPPGSSPAGPKAEFRGIAMVICIPIHTYEAPIVFGCLFSLNNWAERGLHGLPSIAYIKADFFLWRRSGDLGQQTEPSRHSEAMEERTLEKETSAKVSVPIFCGCFLCSLQNYRVKLHSLCWW